MMMKRIILGITLISSVSLFARHVDQSSADASTHSYSGKTNIGDCNPSTSQAELDINNVRARLLAGGDFWWDGVEEARYEVPKVDVTTGEIPVNSIFAGALWFSALDDGGNLKVAAQTYRGQGHDFWTGPLRSTLPNIGEVKAETCNRFDQHFEVFGEDIDLFISVFEEKGGNITSSDIPTSLKRWPGKGNSYLVAQEGFPEEELSEEMAPFFDYNGDGVYNPLFGDYPVIGVGDTSRNYAHQMIFWVINDKGNIHSRTSGQALGVQVNCLAFAYEASDEVNNMTFYSYKIVKKSPGQLFETYMGQFVDPDLGEYLDDYIGCDTVRSLGYVYNSAAIDGQYGANPPILGVDYFEGPTGDSGEELGMSSFVYFNNAASGPQTDPDNAPEFRNYQTGLWKDGTPIQTGSDGYNTGGDPTNYVYPASPHLTGPDDWSECSAGTSPDDRRFLQNSGPFTLSPGVFQKITVGVIWVRPTSYSPCALNIEEVLGPADDIAQSLFDNEFEKVEGPNAPTLKIRELSNKLIITLVNSPSSNNFGELYEQAAPGAATFEDSTYKFQGYKLYEVKNSKVTAQELGDPDKARLVMQADIKDGIADIYNFEFDPVNQVFVPVLQTQGEDKGIVRSIEVTTSQFAEGNPTLVNHTPYYFAAIAYAYNNFASPTDTGVSVFQTERYKQGDRNFQIYSAIPHQINARNEGTVLNAEYGQGLPVKRIEGKGNGGNVLNLTQASEDAILLSPENYLDIIEYEAGATPIAARIIDPVNVQNVDFELYVKSLTTDTTLIIVGTDTSELVDTVPDNIVNDQATWVMYVSQDGMNIDTILSDRPMNRPYEQIIEKYGISINLGTPRPISLNERNGNSVYDYLTSSIEFEDVENKWLRFVADEAQGEATPSNWIRSGEDKSTVDDAERLFNVYDAHTYNSDAYDFVDPDGIFASVLEGGMAPYCLASNYFDIDPGMVSGGLEPLTMYGPAFKWNTYDDEDTDPQNTLDILESVDIVFTDDRSKWSKCIVFEMGEDPTYTLGGARKGMIRASESVDLFGDPMAGGELGRSYFPGYAINVETGERLNIAFGENSIVLDHNGGDMIWNPTDAELDALSNIPGTADNDVPFWGGQHTIYVFNSRYDEGSAAHSVLFDYYSNPPSTSGPIPSEVSNLYNTILYTGIPLLTQGKQLKSINDGLIPTKTRIKIRVERPYGIFPTIESYSVEGNDSLPRYQFSTVGLGAEENVLSVAESALDDIRVVPNPYYAFSAYEESQIDNAVKITNLPNRCIVSIYTLDGKLVRRFDRAVGNQGRFSSSRQDIALGQPVGEIANLDNSQRWDLKNEQNIPVGSGFYIIHVEAPGIGEKTTKAAVFLRPSDVSSF